MIKAQKKKNFNTVLIIAVSFLIGLIGGYLTGFKYGQESSRISVSPAMPQELQRPLSRVNLSSMALEVIKELNCICDCKMELLPCTCDEPRGSKEIKQFVQALIEEGLPKSEVIARTVKKYGQAVLIKNSA